MDEAILKERETLLAEAAEIEAALPGDEARVRVGLVDATGLRRLRLRLERRQQRLGHISIMLTAGRKLAELEAKKQQRQDEVEALQAFLDWQAAAHITEELHEVFYAASAKVPSSLVIPVVSSEAQVEWAVQRLCELKVSREVCLPPC